MTKVAVLDDYQEVALQMADWKSLPSETEVVVFKNHLSDENDISKRLEEFEIVSAMRERTPFPKRLLEKLPNLRLLVTTGMRNASIDTSAASELGITVCGTEGLGYPTAELTWGLIVSLARKISEENSSSRSGSWQTTLGIGLNGKTLGILGLGKLGSQVARIGNAFGMDIIAWSQNLTEKRAIENGVTLATFDDLMKNSDFLSIHTVLSERTRGLIGEKELNFMKPTAFLINTSRGPIVDEEALVQALREGVIAGAGLDVFDTEPLPCQHPFLTLPNTLITPHVGYVTVEGYEIFYRQTVECISQFLNGTPVRILNP